MPIGSTSLTNTTPVLPDDAYPIQVKQPDTGLERLRLSQELKLLVGVDDPGCTSVTKAQIEKYVLGGASGVEAANFLVGDSTRQAITEETLSVLMPKAKGPVEAALRYLHVAPDPNVRANKQIQNLIATLDEATAAIVANSKFGRFDDAMERYECNLSMVYAVNAVAERLERAKRLGAFGLADREVFAKLEPALHRFADEYFGEALKVTGLLYFGEDASAVEAFPESKAYLTNALMALD
jgi:hypothetical protein